MSISIRNGVRVKDEIFSWKDETDRYEINIRHCSGDKIDEPYFDINISHDNNGEIFDVDIYMNNKEMKNFINFLTKEFGDGS